MTSELLWIIPAMFVVAALYGGVGHGGASGYFAVMTLAAFAPATMRPTALVLNIAVSFLGTIFFFRAGHFRGSLFWPFAAFSIPCAFWGGTMKLPPGIFHGLLAFALASAAARLLLPAPDGGPHRTPGIWQVALCGAGIGFVSGLIGVGGGIFLTPLLILLRWAGAKTAAGVSAPFILVNSLAGLAGMGAGGVGHISAAWPSMAAAVLAGGAIGAGWGCGAANPIYLKTALSLVLALAAWKLVISL